MPFGNFSDRGLSTKKTSVLSVFSIDDLAELSDNQYNIAHKLFENYKHVFAKENYDLGCAANTQHVVEVGDHYSFAPILIIVHQLKKWQLWKSLKLLYQKIRLT